MPGIESWIAQEFCSTSANDNTCITTAMFTAESIARLKFGDFNGDGITDIYYFHTPPFGNASDIAKYVEQVGNVVDKVFLFDSQGQFIVKNGLPPTELKMPPGGIGNYGGPLLARYLARIRIADFNGDGISDIYSISDKGFQNVYLFDRTGQVGPPVRSTEIRFDDVPFLDHDSAMHNYSRIKVGDFNGDGIADIYYVRGLGGPEWGLPTAAFVDKIYLLNAKGQTEKVIDGATTYVSDIPAEAAEDLNRIKFGDFNGDGRTDIYVIKGADQTWPAKYPSADLFNFNKFLESESQPTADEIYYSTAGGNFLQKSGLNTSVFSVAVQNSTCRDVGTFGARESVPMAYKDSNGNDAVRMSHGRPGIEGIQICYPVYSPIFNVYMNRYLMVDLNNDGTTDMYRVDARTETGNPDQLYLFSQTGGINKTSPPIEIDGNNIGMRGPTSISSWPFEIYAWMPMQLDLQRFRFGDFNGDGVTDLYHLGGQGEGGPDRLFWGASKPVLLESVTNGLGATTTIHYSKSTDKNVISTELVAGNSLPKSTKQVVSKLTSDNGLGGVSTKQYRYAGFQYDDKKRTLGFRTIEETDERFVTQTEFFQKFPFIGQLKTKTVTNKKTNTLLSKVDVALVDMQACYSLGAGKDYPYSAYPKSVSTKTYDLDTGELLKTLTSTTRMSADCLGNMEYSSQTTQSPAGDVYKTSVQTDFDAFKDSAEWLIARPSESTIQKQSPKADGGIDHYKKSTKRDYHPGTLAMHHVTEFPELKEAQSREYLLDKYGNVMQTAVCSGDTCSAETPNARVTKTVFNDGSHSINGTPTIPGQFLDYSVNPEDHKTTYEFDARFGQPNKVTNASGIAACSQMDDFGRPLTSTQLCGTAKSITTKIQRAPASDEQIGTIPAVYLERVDTQGGAYSVTYFDGLNRVLRKQSIGHKGKEVAVDTHYDSFGRIEQVSEPYITDEESSRVFKQSEFDDLDRVRKFTPADGGSDTIITYEGDTKTTTRVVNGQTRSNQEIYNALGQTEEIVDANRESTNYQYYASGLLFKTIDPLLNEIVLTYDARGNKTSMQDPDMGNWSYTYTPFDELETQTDAKQVVTTFKYDKLSRLVFRSAPDGSVANTSNWSYDTAPGASIGLIASESDQSGYQKRYTYDEFGRAKDDIEVLPGHSGEMITSRIYDDYSRVRQLRYPGGSFSLIHQYSENTGQLTQLQSNDATPHVYWSLTEVNARGQIKEELFGNGMVTQRDYDPANGWLRKTETHSSPDGKKVHSMSYDFDDVGSISWRQDNLRNIRENFYYDFLDRIDSSTLNGVVTDYGYDELGNITTKSDVGTYYYNEPCNGRTPGPHAVARIAGPQGGNYCYDANGNMIDDGQQKIAYTLDNKPKRFTQQGKTVAEFFYSPAGNRYKKVAPDKTLFYVGQDAVGRVLYEKEVATGTTEKYYLYAGELAIGTVAMSSSNTFFEYYHRDHLNSVEVVSRGDGVFASPKSFDSYGRPRLPDWTSLDPFAIQSQSDSRGYTGHEHIDETGLIHMNGRVYNPILGRFISADPTIQFAKVQQSYNRYSYVANNPLKYTDPTGYQIDGFGMINEFLKEKENEKRQQQDENNEQENKEREKAQNDAGATSSSHSVSAGGTVNPTAQMTQTQGTESQSNFKWGLESGRNHQITGRISDAPAGVDPNSVGRWVGEVIGTAIGVIAQNPTASVRVGVISPICCFAEGTLVQTDEGDKPIEAIKIGDNVWSKNPETGEKALKPVTHLFKKLRPLYELKVASASGAAQLIQTTEDHPFYIYGKGWVAAGELIAGDVIESNKEGIVTVVAGTATTQIITTYNIEVADFHTYYATEFGLLVHNACNPNAGAGRARQAGVAVSGRPGSYIPDRQLPTNGRDYIPDSDLPHTQLGRSKPKYGSEPQGREWGFDEKGTLIPLKDIDFTDHGFPDQHPWVPHQHRLIPNNPKTAPKGGFKREDGEPLNDD